VAQLCPLALGSLYAPSYDSEGYGGGILTRPHTGQSLLHDRRIVRLLLTVSQSVCLGAEPTLGLRPLIIFRLKASVRKLLSCLCGELSLTGGQVAPANQTVWLYTSGPDKPGSTACPINWNNYCLIHLNFVVSRNMNEIATCWIYFTPRRLYCEHRGSNTLPDNTVLYIRRYTSTLCQHENLTTEREILLTI
jgi:hypothetical protein